MQKILYGIIKENASNFFKNIKIFNFIGTPNAIQFNDKNMTFEKAKATFLDNLKNINIGLRCTFQDPIEDQDTLLTFFHDKYYVENPDFVVI